jgi:hypothetical protein
VPARSVSNPSTGATVPATPVEERKSGVAKPASDTN